ncbi:hypothetical protein F4780DRAFT_51676 [Xylariomycetidae sp. FL0641]|nr:hypothetical protein F4780DRAFT_51676 [Xylariomycetidae sp. FL0641]
MDPSRLGPGTSVPVWVDQQRAIPQPVHGQSMRQAYDNPTGGVPLALRPLEPTPYATPYATSSPTSRPSQAYYITDGSAVSFPQMQPLFLMPSLEGLPGQPLYRPAVPPAPIYSNAPPTAYPVHSSSYPLAQQDAAQGTYVGERQVQVLGVGREQGPPSILQPSPNAHRPPSAPTQADKQSGTFIHAPGDQDHTAPGTDQSPLEKQPGILDPADPQETGQDPALEAWRKRVALFSQGPKAAEKKRHTPLFRNPVNPISSATSPNPESIFSEWSVHPDDLSWSVPGADRVKLMRIGRIEYRDNKGKWKQKPHPYASEGRHERPLEGPVLESASAILLLRQFDEEGFIAHHVLRILSSTWEDVLSEVMDMPAANIRVCGPRIEEKEPFADIFYRKKGLQSFVSKHDGPSSTYSDELNDTLDCTRCLLEVLANDFSDLSETFDSYQSSNPPTTIEHDNLWMIYCPGTVVYRTCAEDEQVEAFIVGETYLSKRMIELDLHSLGFFVSPPVPYSMTAGLRQFYNGRFGLHHSPVFIRSFPGSTPIAQLEYVPDRFYVTEPIKDKLVARGKQFWAFHQPVYRQIAEGKPGSRDRVMVDREAFLRYERVQREAAKQQPDIHSTPLPQGTRRRGWMRLKMKGPSRVAEYRMIYPWIQATDYMFMLFPARVDAFSLVYKTWAKYNVVDLEPVQFQDTAWKRLVLDPEYKDVISAMVVSYLQKSEVPQDLVPGKGNGIVILLHGPPGVGKTLTAGKSRYYCSHLKTITADLAGECVSERFQKPLYRVTAGDLGTDPENLELKLKGIFDRAMRWDAILLLDEADIFLQDRDYENLTRNALVTIFLRTLEYFKGILFLTSNRVGVFDQAFQSRIHITLGLPEFSDDVRREVWAIFIKDLGRKRSDGKEPILTEDECKALGKEVLNSWDHAPLNGRQIRNCVRSALALAHYKNERLCARHFNVVIRLGSTFTQYMTRLQKHEADELAQIRGERLADMRDLLAHGQDRTPGHDVLPS